jgi:hypothetical protein
MIILKKTLSDWFFWHFFEIPKEIGKVWRNFLFFNYYYFSITILLKTLFYPWRKYYLSYGEGFNLKRYFEVFVFNSFSRAIGFFLRSSLILIGLLFEILLIIIGIVVIFGWLFLPFLLFLGFYYAFK